jgi:hypothetical protein
MDIGLCYFNEMKKLFENKSDAQHCNDACFSNSIASQWRSSYC